jgi:hypothetical protein
MPTSAQGATRTSGSTSQLQWLLYWAGQAFYAAQQVKSPRPPTLLDIPAFVIMAAAAGAIPAILETTRILQVRLLRDTKVELPQEPRVPPDAPLAD